MKFNGVLFISAALLGTVSARPAAEDPDALFRRQFPVLPCSHLTGGIHVIAGAGANTPNPKEYGLLGSLATSILKAIPGSTNVSLPYDKVFATLNPPKLSPNAVPDGMNTLQTYIKNYHYACPHTKIALIGYSSGGIIIMNDLCSATGSPTKINPALSGPIIIGTVVYGEETRTPGASYNVGSCPSQYGGLAPRANTAACAPFSQHLISFCDNEDPDCCVGSGDNLQVHYNYPTKYDALATSWIVSRLKAEGGA